jgi:uncharacterized protein
VNLSHSVHDLFSVAVAQITAAVPDVVAIYRFGTAGTEFERADSDIDLGVLGAAPYEAGMLWNVAHEVAAALKRDVDLVDLRTASTVFQARIIAEGDRLYCTNAAYCDGYEMYILSSYARLNEERRGILEDIASRGSIHGR